MLGLAIGYGRLGVRLSICRPLRHPQRPELRVGANTPWDPVSCDRTRGTGAPSRCVSSSAHDQVSGPVASRRLERALHPASGVEMHVLTASTTCRCVRSTAGSSTDLISKKPPEP